MILSPVCAIADEIISLLFILSHLSKLPGLNVPPVTVKEAVAAVPVAVPPVIVTLTLALISYQSVILFVGSFPPV